MTLKFHHLSLLTLEILCLKNRLLSLLVYRGKKISYFHWVIVYSLCLPLLILLSVHSIIKRKKVLFSNWWTEFIFTQIYSSHTSYLAKNSTKFADLESQLGMRNAQTLHTKHRNKIYSIVYCSYWRPWYALLNHCYHTHQPIPCGSWVDDLDNDLPIAICC